MSRITRALLLAGALALLVPASAAAALNLEPVGNAGDFTTPMYVASPPGDTHRLFVVERAGVVKVVRDGVTQPTPVLDISADVNQASERGLLSIAFPPDYATTGLFYVYLASNPAGQLQIREYHRSASNPDVADPAGRIVWRQDHPAGNHNGGTIAFGRDGKLWLAPGDGADQANAQVVSSQLGKVLRIDPHRGNAGEYTVPSDNPYGTAVWASGLRNPFRWSFDRVTGDLVIGDVGDTAHEEIDFVRWPGLGRGANFGWPCREGLSSHSGTCMAAPLTDPVIDFPRPDYTAVTGGVVVRDPGLPSLAGRYIYADYFNGVIKSLALDLPRASDDQATGLTVANLVNFGEDACGHVYVVSTDGTIDRLQDGAIGACVPGFQGSGTTQPSAAPGRVVPAADRTPPRVRIRVAGKGRVGRRGRPQIALTASEACRVTIRARLGGWTLRRARTSLRAGRRTVIRLRPKAKAVKRIRRSLRRHKHLTLRVSVTAVDAAGNTGHAQRRLKVKRA
jgi:glucose/arabinose dehydrogenase